MNNNNKIKEGFIIKIDGRYYYGNIDLTDAINKIILEKINKKLFKLSQYVSILIIISWFIGFICGMFSMFFTIK